MIFPSGVGLVLAAVAACTPGEPLPRDAAAAELYLEVAEEELAREDRAAAHAAYEKALRLDPHSARARAGFHATCGAPRAEAEPLAKALEAMRRGDCAEAVAHLDGTGGPAGDPDVALLRGICLYELAQDAAARTALQAAAAHPPLSETATLYLALLALREDDAAAARALLVPLLAGEEEATRSTAEALLRVARDQSRLLLVLSLDASHDTNPYLVPLAVAPAGVADQWGLLSAAVQLRPFGSSGPFVALLGSYRELRQTGDYDGALAGVALGHHQQLGEAFLRAGYHLDAAWLGGAPYATTHRLALAAGGRGGGLGLSGRYEARWEEISASRFEDYSGLHHEAALAAERWFGDLGLSAGWGLERSGARTPELRYLAHGPRAQLRLWPAQPRSLRLHLALVHRTFDDADPSLGVRRADRLVEGGARFELELAEALRAHLSAVGAIAWSNAAAFTHARLALVLGLSWEHGAW